MIQLGRSGHRPDRRHREHEPGAARHSRLRAGLKLGQGKLEDSLYEGAARHDCGLFMAETAEKCAASYGISREEQDALRAAQSATGATRRGSEGRFAEEVVPVEIKTRKGVHRRRAATITCVLTRRSRGSPSCRLRFRRTAP